MSASWVLVLAAPCLFAFAVSLQQSRQQLTRSESKRSSVAKALNVSTFRRSAPESVQGASLVTITDRGLANFDRVLKSDLQPSKTSFKQKGFNWGAGCDAGSGSFSASLAEGDITLVGDIPKGKADINILLTAPKDADIQLYDMEGCDGEGLPLIAYSESKNKCKRGSLGNNDGTAESMDHKGMRIEYSGYYGGGTGKEGVEFIKITGEVTTALQMRAFGFEATTATINYSWGRTPTPCCLGVAPCGGSFMMDIQKDQVVDIGEIPAGKADLQVSLEADEDVDIQLFDLDDKECEGGKAIVAYSEDTDACGKGHLGNNDGGKESVQYKDRDYVYSGYYGISEGLPGKEYIKIGGVLNRKLSMKAYGYAAGRALVKYWYYEDYQDPGKPTPVKLSPISMWVAAQLHQTAEYKGLPTGTIVVRRGGPEFEIKILNADKASCSVAADVEQWVTFDECKATIAKDSPVGNYSMQVKLDSGENTVANLIILFNPYKSTDETYVRAKKDRAEYLQGTTGLIWQGTSDDYSANTWEFDQFDPLSLDISLLLIRRMPVQDRASAVLVARHLSYSINEDLCYGRWGGGSYISGKPAGGYKCSKGKPCYEPGHWTGTLQLLKHFDGALNRADKVQYCQCFVYAGVFSTFGRALGIASRPVTTFQSAHDTNKNRAIDKFYKMHPDGTMIPVDSGDSLVPSSLHDSVWSFHVWTELYFKRNDVTGGNGWQAVDATPQELSAGGNSGVSSDPIYQLGPAPVKHIKKNKDTFVSAGWCNDSKYGCFDAEFVISEVNSNVNMWYLEEAEYSRAQAEDAEPSWKFWSSSQVDPFGDDYGTIGYQTVTKKPGEISVGCLNQTDTCSSELLDLTTSYKKKEPSGPGDPTAGPPLSSPELPASFESLKERGIASDLRWSPRKAGPVVVQSGSDLASVTLEVSLHNNGTSTETASCYFSAVMYDYSGTVFQDGHPKSLRASVTLDPGETKTCGKFTYAREDYITAFRREGYAAPAEEQEAPYAVEFFVSTAGLMRHHQKLFCVPQPGAPSLCEGRRGLVPTPASLLERTDDGACADLGTRQACIGQQQCKWEGRCSTATRPESRSVDDAMEDLDVTSEVARSATPRARPR